MSRDTVLWTLLFCLYLVPLETAAANPSLFADFQAGAASPLQMGTFALVNLDDDPALELVVASPSGLLGGWRLEAFKKNGSRVPGFPFAAPGLINSSPTICDLDGDGKSEILFASGNQIIALNRDGSMRWSQTISSLNYVPDAGFEAVTNGFYWSPSGVFIPRLPLTAQFSSEVSPPFLADVTGDGRPEVLTAWKIDPDPLTTSQDYNPFINDTYGRFEEWGATGETWSGGVVLLDPQNGAQSFTYHFHQLVEAGLAVGQVDDRSSRLVYVLNDADSVAAFDKTQPPGLFGSGMLYKQFGKNQRLLSGSYQTGVDVYSADLDGDGRSEVLVPTTQIEPNWQPSETILDDDGAIIWRKWKQPVTLPRALGWFNSACMIPVNPDHDNHVDVFSFTHSTEIAFRSWDGINLVDRPGWPKNFAPLLPTSPVIGDIDGDGEEEVVIGLCDPSDASARGAIRVFNLAGVQKYSISFESGIKQIPALADFDGDGKIDLVVRTLNGRVQAFTFGAQPNAAVSWATHRGNMARDGLFERDLFPAGTPIVFDKKGSFRKATLRWRQKGTALPIGFKVNRSAGPAAPFSTVANLPGSAREFVDAGLQNGQLYLYEIVAVYGNGEVRSAPVPVIPELNGNLLVNGSFEENDNSHWDKWFTGEIPWERMTGTSVSPHGGTASMKIDLKNDGNNSSISQYSHYGAPQAYLPVRPGGFYSFGGFLRTDGLSAASEHWLEWDSSITAANTNRRPALPWPNYFTPSMKAPAGTAVDWTYLNRVFVVPPGFPNVELRHRFTVTAPATGSVQLDDLFFREWPAPSDARWQPWIPFESSWHYETATPPDGWFASGFNDNGWRSGRAKFGAGTGPTNIRTALVPDQPAYYFRTKFTIPQSSWEDILLQLRATDNSGGIIYPLQLWINGRPIPGPIEAVSGEGNDTIYYDLTPFADYFVQGQNVVAARVQNVWEPDWDNVAFDLALSAIAPPSRLAEFRSARYLSDHFVEFEVNGNGSWVLQGKGKDGGWVDIQLVNFDIVSPQTVNVPCGEGWRFFRLVGQ